MCPVTKHTLCAFAWFEEHDNGTGLQIPQISMVFKFALMKLMNPCFHICIIYKEYFDRTILFCFLLLKWLQIWTGQKPDFFKRKTQCLFVLYFTHFTLHMIWANPAVNCSCCRTKTKNQYDVVKLIPEKIIFPNRRHGFACAFTH